MGGADQSPIPWSISLSFANDGGDDRGSSAYLIVFSTVKSISPMFDVICDFLEHLIKYADPSNKQLTECSSLRSWNA